MQKLEALLAMADTLLGCTARQRSGGLGRRASCTWDREGGGGTHTTEPHLPRFSFLSLSDLPRKSEHGQIHHRRAVAYNCLQRHRLVRLSLAHCLLNFILSFKNRTGERSGQAPRDSRASPAAAVELGACSPDGRRAPMWSPWRRLSSSVTHEWLYDGEYRASPQSPPCRSSPTSPPSPCPLWAKTQGNLLGAVR